MKANPIANCVKIIPLWFWNNGIQFLASKSIKPPPISPTTPNAYMVVAIVAAKAACTANNGGDTNKNVNSSGSVIPANTAVKVAGITKARTFFLFSGFAVK